MLNWSTKLKFSETVDMTINWYKKFYNNENLLKFSLSQIKKYEEKMKVVILAGGLGSRLSEYTKIVPKPMVKILKVPIIVRIINFYIKFGYKDFLIAGGYKSEVIEKYFKNNLKNLNIKVVNTGKKQ